ncbi:MAG: response regulator [Candidatus Zixiibacteriota bacterium]
MALIDGEECAVSKKIMIVDDEADPRTYLEALFQDSGYTTLTVADGDEAWDKVAEFQPDLITLDIIMARETGVKFYRRLCKDPMLSKIPVIICSGVTQYKDLFSRDHHTMPKPLAFVDKPIDKTSLLELVRTAIG